MKKITSMAVIAVLSGALLIMGCPDDSKDSDTETTAEGNVLILQAYGNAGNTDSPAGVSHSFVELYNIADKAIKLDGISLYFADGIRSTAETPVVTEDKAWNFIALTGTIPAKGSFLILGAKHADLTDTRHKITDGYGDINNNSLSLSRRSFKVALISGSEALTVQNPFTSNNGKPVSGYIDMVGALNNPEATLPDHIFGCETAPARCSASEAVRRKDLTDYDNNSTDFIAARYASTGAGALIDEELELCKPRNTKAGKWDPFAELPKLPPPTAEDYKKIKLNEVSGVGGDSEKFYELINTGAKDIPLKGCKIYYNANSNTGGTLPSGKGTLTWTGLEAQIIKAGKLRSLIGRNTSGSFTTGLTAARILIITLEDPEGNVIDTCVRAADTGDYAITDKSFSRIPDGTGDFYFTTPTSDKTNGTSTAGLKKVPGTQ